jgi:hypothetical protein
MALIIYILPVKTFRMKTEALISWMLTGCICLITGAVFAMRPSDAALGIMTPVTYTVYISALNGDDLNDGAAPGSAWQSLEKVNSTLFGPGARILLERGSTWYGQLAPQGEGSKDAPILLDAYGEGPLPLIHGNGMTGEAVVRLVNQSFWEISNIELTNPANSQGDRRGVEILAANYGILRHIHLKNLHIHHVAGIVGNGLDAKRTAGIYVAVTADGSADTRFDDLLIEGCHLHHIENQGIVTNNEVKHSDYPGTYDWNRRRFTNVTIRNNIIHHISKNAIICRLTDGGMVEHNLCYETALGITGNTIFSRSAQGTIFQFNEGFYNRSPGADGSLYDADLNSPKCIFQYSYSHDNAHGLFWMCTSQPDHDVIVRYNLSVNDRGSIFCMNYANTSTFVYNNTVYIGEHLSPLIIDERRNENKAYVFCNNLIYNMSPTAGYQWFNAKRTISNNLFFGFHPESEPDDPAKVTEDPLLNDPEKQYSGLAAATTCMLRSGSPAVKAGTNVPDNGGFDYFGHPLPYGEYPNIGFHNMTIDERSDHQPDHDAFIRTGPDQDNNFGIRQLLEVTDSSSENISRTLLSFTIGEEEVSMATIRLYCSELTFGSVIGLYSCGTDWEETTLTEASAPARGDLIATVPVVSEGVYYSWDVTNALHAAIAAGKSAIGFLLEGYSGMGGTVSFNSDESAEYGPVLELFKENNFGPTSAVPGFERGKQGLFTVYQDASDPYIVNINYTGEAIDSMDASLIDMSGKIHYKQPALPKGNSYNNYVMQIDREVPAGMYVILLKTDHDTTSAKVWLSNAFHP